MVTEHFDEFIKEFEANVNLGAILSGQGSCDEKGPCSAVVPSLPETQVATEAELIQQFIAHRGAGKRLRLRKTMSDEAATKEVLVAAAKGIVEGEGGRSTLLNAAEVRARVIEPFSEVFLDAGDMKWARRDLCMCDDFSPSAICICLLFWTPCCVLFPWGNICDCICGPYKEFTITRTYDLGASHDELVKLVSSIKEPVLQHIEERGLYEYNYEACQTKTQNETSLQEN